MMSRGEDGSGAAGSEMPFRATLLTLMVTAGCRADLSVPDGSEIRCGPGATCPAGMRCSERVQACVRTGGGDTQPPAVLPVPDGFEPPVVGPGGSVDVSLSVTEALAFDPVLVLDLPGAPPLERVGGSGLDYTFRYAPGGDEPDGSVAVLATLVDLAGNLAADLVVHLIVLDLTAPGLAGLALDGPAFLPRDGATAVTFQVGEPLGAAPQVTLEPGGAPWTCPDDAASPVRCTFTPGEDAVAGVYDVRVRVRDPYGNAGGARLVQALTLDFTAPAPVGEPALRGTLTRPGGALGVELTLDEPVGGPVTATIEHDATGRAVELARAEGDAPDRLAFAYVAGADDHGTWSLSITGIRDRAGNPGPSVEVAGAFTVDAVPPAPAEEPVFDRDPPAYRWGEPISVQLTPSEPLGEAGLLVELATAPPVPFSCRPADPAGAYACELAGDAVAPGAAGPVAVRFRLVDPAGNTGEAEALVTLDSDAPQVVSAVATPAVARPGDTVLVTLGVSEPLGGADGLPRLAARRDGDPEEPPLGAPILAEGTRFVWSFVPTGAMEGRWELAADLTDTAGNVATALPAGGFVVDGTPPALVAGPDLGREPPLYRAGEPVAVSFEVSEELAPGFPRVAVAGSPPLALPCVATDPRRFECTSEGPLETEADVERVAALTIEVLDPARNTHLETVALTVDSTPPRLQGVPSFARCDGYGPAQEAANDLWVGVVPAGACPDDVPPVTVAFRLSEAAHPDRPPQVTVAGRALASAAPAPAGTAFVYAYTPDGGEPVAGPGSPVEATVWDRAGNEAAFALGTLRFDFTPPDVAAGTVRDRVVYARDPWGSEASGYRDRAGIEVAGDAFAEAGEVRAWRPPPAQAGAFERLATAWFTPGEPLTIDLGALRVPRVFVSLADRAGNETDAQPDTAGPQPEPVELHDLVATLHGKVAGDPAANPNGLVQAAPDPEHPLDLGLVGHPLETAEAAAGVARLGDGASARVTSASAPWHRWGGPEEPRYRVDGQLAFDAERRRVVLFGGLANGDCGCGAGPLCSDTWEWHHDTWVRRSPLVSPSPRKGHALVWDGARRRVLLVGGGDPGPQVETWTWDGHDWRRLYPETAPPWRAGARLAYDAGRERVVLFGGSDDGEGTCGQDGDRFCGDTWEWDGDDWTEHAVGVAPTGRTGHGMVWDAIRGETVLFGGHGLYTPADGAPYEAYRRDTWTWDGQAWTPLQPAHWPNPRAYHGMVFDPGRGAAVVFGGRGERAGFAVQWDGADWSGDVGWLLWDLERTGSTFDAEAGHVLTYGGAATGGRRAEGWVLRWTGTDWLQLVPRQGPPRRPLAMAFDQARDRLVAFTAYDLLEWDGSRWDWRPAPAELDGAEAAAMAWDPAAGRVEVVVASPDDRLDVWSWDGAQWSRTDPPARPPAREHFAVARDDRPGRGRLVLFGGTRADAGACALEADTAWCDDTWEWDGETWELAAPERRPPGRYLPVMAAGPDGVVLTGAHLPDLWCWDGDSWTECAAPGPAARWDAGLAFDTWRARLVLSTEGSGSWELDGGRWVGAEGTAPTLPTFDPLAVFDERRGRVLVWGDSWGSPGECNHDGFCQDLWLRSAGAARPHLVVGFDLTAAGIPAAREARRTTVEELTVRVSAGGLGHRPPGGDAAGEPVAGVDAAMAAFGAGGWVPLGQIEDGTPDAPADRSWSLGQGWECGLPGCTATLDDLVSGDGLVRVALGTRAPQGQSTEEAVVALDYAELRVRYRLLGCDGPPGRGCP